VRADTLVCVSFYLEDANRLAKPTQKLESFERFVGVRKRNSNFRKSSLKVLVSPDILKSRSSIHYNLIAIHSGSNVGIQFA